MRFYIEVGEQAVFSKTVTETDIAMFSAVSGDFDPVHVDDAYAAGTRFGRRIAHGILSMALLSTVSAMISRRAGERGFPGVSVSLGYDRVRFLAPVFIGDTLTATYTVQALEPEKGRSRSKVEVTKHTGELAVVGEHIMAWLEAA